MLFKYIFLGALQGLFEWLPVSSEAVVALAGQFFSIETNLVDTALFLHLGTLLALLIYFRRQWWELIKGKNQKLRQFLIVTTLISLCLGFFVYKVVREAAIGNSLLLLTGLSLLLTAFFNRQKNRFRVKEKYLSFLAGIFQGLAVIPGLSRSGSTIFALSLGKSDTEEILKTSYLMSAPVVLVSNGYLFLENPTLAFKAWPALIFSFVIGFIALHFLLNWAKKVNFFKFALLFSFLCLGGALIGFLI